MVMAVCGVDCSTCPIYEKECNGCYQIKGCAFWAPMLNAEICPIYDCVINKKNYKNCGECSDLPCEMYKSLKDPSMTDEEHVASIERRVKNLKNKK